MKKNDKSNYIYIYICRFVGRTIAPAENGVDSRYEEFLRLQVHDPIFEYLGLQPQVTFFIIRIHEIVNKFSYL